MSVDIEAIVRRGYERTVARNGLQLAAVLFVISLLDAMFSVRLVRGADLPGGFDPLGMAAAGASPPVSLGLSSGVASLASLLLTLVALVVTLGALRTLVTDETETLPREHFTEDVVWPVANLLVGGIIFGVVVGIGLLLLVVPGLFLLVSLFLWEVFVAAEGDSFVGGFRRSWDLTSGHRLRLFALGVVVVVIAIVVSIVFGLPSVLLPRVVGFLVEQVGEALLGVFVLATVTETYRRLADREDAPADVAEAA